MSETRTNNRDTARILAEIQKRVDELSAQHQTLKQLENQVAQRQEVINERRQSMILTRMDYLRAVRQHHGVELELLQLKREAADCREQAKSMIEEEEVLDKEKEELETSWCNHVETLAEHRVRRRLYLSILQATIGKTEEAHEKRREKLQLLTDTVSTMISSQEDVMDQKEVIEDDIRRLEACEQVATDGVQALAEKVRSRLSKRSELRKALRTAQKSFRDADQRASDRESELVEL